MRTAVHHMRSARCCPCTAQEVSELEGALREREESGAAALKALAELAAKRDGLQNQQRALWKAEADLEA